jgi:hypothetical protein
MSVHLNSNHVVLQKALIKKQLDAVFHRQVDAEREFLSIAAQMTCHLTVKVDSKTDDFERARLSKALRREVPLEDAGIRRTKVIPSQ